MTSESPSSVKPNILALPTQTFAMFLLIVGTLLGAALLGSLGGSPVPFWLLPLALLLLPLRAFLKQPELEIAEYRLRPAGDGLSLLEREINNQAKRLGLRRTPRLFIGTADTPLYAYGTFRHLYLAMSAMQAHRLQEQLGDPQSKPVAQATILHELSHFKTGDYWQLGYVKQLLRFTFWIMLWGLFFFGGFSFLLIFSMSTFFTLDPPKIVSQFEALSPEQRQRLLEMFPSAQELSALRQKIATVNMGLVLSFVFNATLPFIILCAILQIFYWPKLWRVRELYADAGVWLTQRRTNPLIARLLNIPLPILDRFPAAVSTISNPAGINGGCSWRAWWTATGQLIAKHPNDYRRLACLQNSRLVFDSWPKTAFWVGSLTLLLDILLSTPVGLLYVGNWPMHFSTLVVLIIISITSIPRLTIGQMRWKDLFVVVGIIMVLRLGWLLLTIGLLLTLLVVAPQTLSEVLSSGVAGIARFAGYSDDLIFGDLSGFVLQASVINLVQIFIIWLVLFAGLSLNILLLRRVFTWYSLSQRRVIRAGYVTIIFTTLLVAFSILPLLTQLLLAPLKGLSILNCIFLTVGMILIGIGGGIFVHFDRKYGQRCPHCGQLLPGLYYFGRRCSGSKCSSPYLHPWLIADYVP